MPATRSKPKTALAPMPRAYSYLRFSTPAQSEGDSFRRQTALAERYAAEHGLELDQSLKFHDLGVSAYRGANSEHGRLADFKEAVGAGVVPRGSFLLMESLDRLSRLSPWDAMNALQQVISLDIQVVTLTDGKVYTKQTLAQDYMALMMAVMYFIRANEESVTKGRRIRAAWEAKRARAGEQPLTASCPGWLRLDTARKTFVVDEEKAVIVRRIFSELRQGVGQEMIAARLNQEGVPCFGRGTMWRRSYIHRMRSNPAVVGTFIPHIEEYSETGFKRLPQPPMHGYFPSVIEQQHFDEVQLLAKSRAPGTKAATGIRSMLAGLAKCHLCGGTMTRVSKGSKSKAGKPYLVCAASKEGKEQHYRGVPLQQVEEMVIEHLPFVLSNPPYPDEESRDRRDALAAGLEGVEFEIGSVLDAIGAKPHARLLKRLEELSVGAEELKAELAEFDQAHEVGDYGLILSRASNFAAALPAMEGDPARINPLLRQLFSGITVNYESGNLEFEWRQGGSIEVFYAWPAPRAEKEQ